MDAVELVRQGDVDGALKALIAQVRADTADAKLRVFLFQLLSVTGDWSRAKTHLDVARGLDPAALLMAEVYGDAIACEPERQKLFSGAAAPAIYGGAVEPWMAQLGHAFKLDAAGDSAAAAGLRAEAYDAAPTIAGSVNGTGFDWIADGDNRLGPMLELVVGDRYVWLPFTRISRLGIEAPSDLRDRVWTPVQILLTDGKEISGLVPTRYFGSEKNADPLIRLARKTDWREIAADSYAGLGQRILITDQGEFPIMDIRQIIFQPIVEAAEGAQDG